MRTETITLGGQEYELQELPLRKNAEWRAQLEARLQEFTELMGRATTTELTDTGSVLPILREASQMVLHSPDTLAELLFAYAPELAQQREQILDSAYESELMEAFGSVLKLAFPFGRLARQMLALVESGSDAIPSAPTSTNGSRQPTPTPAGSTSRPS